MSRLLVVETSPRGDRSISRHLTRRFVDRWRQAHPQGEIVHRDLAATPLPFVDAPWLTAYFTPPGQWTPDMRARMQGSDTLVAEVLAADHIVIATPVYNYNVPASLKAWIDHIVRKGLTLGMDGRGLVTGTRATVLVASGGVYTRDSPIRDRDIAVQYLRLVLGVIGIDDVTVVAAGGAKAVDLGEVGMDDFVGRFHGAIAAAAA
ncbi:MULTISPECIES: FMN-dependent NADH-azoreductase [Luteimonas]|uniref:FMN-dependent NADH-azoreductase n=1 Tax=Luteimonas TaxID=83614 RepID=UPI000C7DE19C|nr:MULTISPECIES: NAD(P)H-dependent oxidoreductase [Luteimonas]